MSNVIFENYCGISGNGDIYTAAWGEKEIAIFSLTNRQIKFTKNGIPDNFYMNSNIENSKYKIKDELLCYSFGLRNIILSIDNGLKWEVKNMYGGNNTQSSIYLYEQIINRVQKIYFKNRSIPYLQVIYLSGKFYLTGENIFLENSVEGDLFKWKQVDWIAPNPSFRNIIFKNNTALGFIVIVYEKSQYIK